jgi:hypothetical protein
MNTHSTACLAAEYAAAFIESQSSAFDFLHLILEVETIAHPDQKIIELQCRDKAVFDSVIASRGLIKKLPGWSLTVSVPAAAAAAL